MMSFSLPGHSTTSVTCPNNGYPPTYSTGYAIQAFMNAIGSVAALQCIITEDWPKNTPVSDGSTFDYIVVGAGSAGATIASRLAEDRKTTVLLVEAGNNPSMESVVTQLVTGIAATEKDWRFKAQNDGFSAQSVRDGQMTFARGKMLGGSSSINYMVYSRGLAADYDLMADQGLYGWEWEVAQHFYKKLEGMNDTSVFRDQPQAAHYYGIDGPLKIERTNYYPEIEKRFVDSLVDIGMPYIPDLNYPYKYGAGRAVITSYGGRRESSVRAYINGKKWRNLHILKDALATKVLINQKSHVANGVEIFTNNAYINVYVRKEVIVSAGVFKTPQLLMLSGIGPRDHLSQFDIETIVDLPVGYNFNDNPDCPIFFTADPNPVTQAQINEVSHQYLENFSGPLGTQNTVNGYVALDNYQIYPDFDIDPLYYRPNATDIEYICKYLYSYTDEVCQKLYKANKDHDIYIIQNHLLQPQSRGRISLQSSDPFDYPIIETGMYSNPDDYIKHPVSMMMSMELLDTDPFKKVHAKLLDVGLPECQRYKYNTYRFWQCYMLQMVVAGNHPRGSCKMGPEGDPTAVVDPKFRVFGVDGLRVVDTSVMVRGVSGHSNAFVFFMAEKAAYLIKN